MASVYIFCFALPSSSQDTLGLKLKNDIGFNTTFFLNNIFQSSSTPFSIMYKKYQTPDKAYRFGIDTNFSIRKNSGIGNFTDQTSYSLSVVLGKEKQNRAWKAWVWYYGLDIVPSFSRLTSINFSNDQKTQEYINSAYGLTARPFLGIRFDINSRLYISSEMNLSLVFSHNTNIQKAFNPEQTIVDTNSNSGSLSLSPASGIFVFYRF
jgi:hypothetical protein